MSHEPGLTKVEVVDSGGDALGVAGNPLVVTSSGAGGVVDQGIAGTAVEAWWVKPTADGVTASLPLPSGAATEASLSSIDGKLPAIGPQLSAQSLSITFATNVPPLTVNIGSTVDRTATGTITATETVELATEGCGTASLQVSSTWTGTVYFEFTVDGSEWKDLYAEPNGGGTLVSSTTSNGTWVAEVASYASVRFRGAVASGSASVIVNASTASTTVALGAPLPPGTAHIGEVSVSASALPSNAAQETGGHLASLDSHLPAQGQALMAASLPVVIASNQSAVAVSGTVTANAGTGTFATNLSQVGGAAVALGQVANAASLPVTLSSTQTGTAGTPASQVLSVQGVTSGTSLAVSQATASSLQTTAVLNDGTATVGTAARPVQVSLANTASNATAVKVDGSAVTQPVSGTVTANAGTGTFTVGGVAASGAAASGNPVLVAGSDGTNVRTLKTDSSGDLVVAGAGTAGSASGGVLTVQGVASGTAIPVSGTVVLGAGSSLIGSVQQNTGGVSLLTSWNVKLTDGSGNGSVAVKPASTAAAATDPALVVRTVQLPASLGQTTASSSVSVGLASDQLGTAGSPSTSVVSVQGVASGTNLNVAQATASSLNAQVVGAGASGSAVSGNPVLTAGSDGTNARTIKTDTAGRGTQAGYAHYMFLNAAATTTLLSGAGVLRSVSIGATATGSVVVYDNTAGSGTVIHSLNGTLSGFFPLNCVVSTGITVVITGTPSVCVVWD